MNYVQVHVIVELMLSVTYKTTIRSVYANQAIQEIHSMDASNWNANRMTSVAMTKRASIMNASILVCWLTRVQ